MDFDVRKALQVMGAGFAMLVLSLPVFSQGNTGRILGTITDQSGGVIPGSTVTVRDLQRGISRALTTDSAGQYSAPNLTPGTYSVRAEATGFRPVEHQNILLEVGQDLRVDLQLQPGDTTQTVTVNETIPLVNTTNSTLGGALSNQTINDLPLNGRNFTNLLTLRPGVAIYPGGGGWTQSTNSLRSHDQMYLVDGVDTNDPWGSQAMINGALPGGDASTLLPLDAIDEFKTEINPPAEYGWKPGSIVNVGIKSGTNTNHGTAYAYGRDGAWDARNYFNAVPALKTPVEVEQFGASFGGPIMKDRLFYFLSYENQGYSVGNPFQHNLPITAAGVSDPNSTLAGSNLIGACQAASTAGTLTALSAQLAGLGGPSSGKPCAPLSNYPGLFVPNNGPTVATGTDLSSNNRIDSGVVKINYQPNQRHSFNGIYIISPGGGTLIDSPQREVAVDWSTFQHETSQVASGNWIWTPGSTWVNEARVSQAREYSYFWTPDHNIDPANYTYHGATYHMYTGQTNPTYFGLPELRISGFNFQLGGGWPYRYGPDAVTQAADHVSVVTGKHNLKFGFDILKNTATSDEASGTKGAFFFSGLQDFFSGIPLSASQLSGNLLRHFSNWGYALFAQDDWRVTQRLTLNIGLRYEIDTVMKEDNNLIGNFDPTQGLQQVGKQIGSLYANDYDNFAPRLGLAWDIRGNGKTVIRAGVGVVYEALSYDVFNAGGAAVRTIPTGVHLYAGGVQLPSPGTIVAGDVTYADSPGNQALTGTTTQGQIAYDWINNSQSVPLFQSAPSCGDGNPVPGVSPTPVPCSIQGVIHNLTTPYVTTWTLDLQRAITNNLSLEIGYVGNHGSNYLGLTDLNHTQLVNGFSPGWGNPAVAGSPANLCIQSAPVYSNCSPDSAAESAARPFANKFPFLQYIPFYSNSDKSNYNSLQTTLTERTSHGLSFTAGYTYAHGLDNSSDNQQVLRIPINGDPRSIYGSSDFDIRHRFTLTATYNLPGKKSPLQILQGWSINSIVTIQTGLPWGVGDGTNDFSGTGEIFDGAGAGSPLGEPWDFFGKTADFTMVHGFTNNNGGVGGVPFFRPGLPPAGDPLGPTDPAFAVNNPACMNAATAMGPLAVASLTNSGCFALGHSVMVPPPYGSLGTAGRNIFRDGGFRDWDFSVSKDWKFRERLTAQFRAEFFNVLNHPNFANPEGGSGGGAGTNDPSAGAGYGCGCVTPDVGGANPVLGVGGSRAIQLGLKLIF